MAIREIRLYEYECDVRHCGVTERVTTRDSLPSGWRTGTVRNADKGGEFEIDELTWIACSEGHVGEAVKVVYDYRHEQLS